MLAFIRCHAYIIGEHGDSEVPIWSTANVAGMKLVRESWEKLPSAEQEQLNSVFEQVKNAAYEIIKRKGYTSYAIGLAVTDIVKAILKSQERVLTVSSFIDGLYDIKDICLSWPTVVNEKGILKTVKLSVNETEQEQLRNSAKVLREVFDQLSLN
ncbi:MAG: hypothetical protein AB4038_10030 [Prochloraceae cyanobacterium]